MEFTVSFNTTLSFTSIILRLFISILIGGIIGYERGRNYNNSAGFRTHILVCLGATIISIMQDQLRVNMYNFITEYPEASQIIKSDLGRLGAQVISGIGFLGAGAIMRDRGVVGGLTTAASIWVTGCIGLTIGWGFYSLAIPFCIAVIIVLVILKKLETRYIQNRYVVQLMVKFKPEYNFTNSLLNTYHILRDMNIQIKNFKKKEQENKVLYTLIISKQQDIMEVMCDLTEQDVISQVYIP